MTGKPVILRTKAMQDIDGAVEFYLHQTAAAVALSFVEELERASAVVSANPAIGSPRYAHELNLPGLRSWQLASQPYLIFYVERSDHIDVWRVLHMHQDVPASMLEPSTPR